MRAYSVLLRKELIEITRTWRIWVLPVMMGIFALLSPLTARFSKELMSSLLPNGAQVQELFADPTWRDSLVQWNKNLTQMGIIVVILVAGGLVNGEARQGTQILILTKPLSRSAYVAAKYCAHVIFLAVVTICATLVGYFLTSILFSEGEFASFIQSSMCWLVLAMVLSGVTLVGSVCFSGSIAASGMGLGAMLLLLLSGTWSFAVKYSPAGLTKAMGDIAGGSPQDIWGPILVSFLYIAALLLVAIVLFKKKEL